MKKFLFLLLAVVSMNAMAQCKVVVAGDNVCLRYSANESSKMTGSSNPHFYTGDVLTCYGQVGNYYEVGYNGGTYYLPKQYGRPRGTTTSSSSSYPNYIVIAGDNVCLRSEPNESSKMTGAWPHLFTGEVYTCTGIVNGYYRIIVDGDVYYVPKKYGRPRN